MTRDWLKNLYQINGLRRLPRWLAVLRQYGVTVWQLCARLTRVTSPRVPGSSAADESGASALNYRVLNGYEHGWYGGARETTRDALADVMRKSYDQYAMAAQFRNAVIREQLQAMQDFVEISDKLLRLPFPGLMATERSNENQKNRQSRCRTCSPNIPILRSRSGRRCSAARA